MKFELEKGKKFERKGINGRSYNTKEEFKKASAAYLEVTGSHGKIKSKKSDRVFLVLDGEGEFLVDGKTVQVKKTDVVIIPKNTPYDYSGRMKLFLVHTPSFDPDAEVKLE